MVGSENDRITLHQLRHGHQCEHPAKASWATSNALFLAIAFFFLLEVANSFGAVRVALMDFAVDDNSYRSAQSAAAFTSLLQNELASESGIEWIERAQLELAQGEFKLRELELLSGSANIRPGHLVKADWLVNGKFSLDDQTRRTLLVEITDLAHADVLAREILTFPGEATTPMKLQEKQVQLVVPMFQRLFRQARQRAQQAENQAIIAPLFFIDLRRFGAGEEFAPLRSAFYDRLEQLELTNSHLRIIRFPKAYLAMDESEMILDGLVESGVSSWENIADLYLWVTYSNVLTSTRSPTNAGLPKTETRHQLAFHIWDGINVPYTFETEYRQPGRERLTVAESKGFWERLEKEISNRTMKRMVGKRQLEVRREISNSMVTLFRGANPVPMPIGDRSRIIENVRLIETACFLSPDNAEAQLLRMKWRWGYWIDFQVKNGFWSKWRQSNAWGNYVEKFGFAGVGFKPPYFFDQREIPRMYVDSLADLLRKFPNEIESDQQMKAEWSSTRQAQRYGFPKDISGDRVAEWKAQVAADLAERKRIAEAYLKILQETNGIPGRPTAALKATAPLRTNAVIRSSSNVPPQTIKPSATNATYRPASAQAKGQVSKAATPQRPAVQAGPRTNVIHPQGMQPFGIYPPLFHLHAPSLWPVEVTPVTKDIIFPAHFDTKTISKMVPWQDQLVILVVDERSAPSSDLNVEISEELLTRSGRLWLVNGQTPPKLLTAPGMPETVHAFLVENDRIWVAGQNFGYLDLKDRSFHVCQKGEGPEALEDQAIAFGGGMLYTLEHLQITRFDPKTSQWLALPSPNARAVYGTGMQTFMTANKDWLCYSAASLSFYNIPKATWTNIPAVYTTRCACAHESGFWIGGLTGLHFYDPDRAVLESWHPPAIFNGVRNLVRPPDLKLLAQDPGERSMGDGFAKTVQTFRKSPITDGMVKFSPPLREPLQLNTRIPGIVTALLADGDHLWLAIYDRLLLLDLPSRSLVACCRFGSPVSSMGMLNQEIWVGLSYGKQLLTRVPQREFYSVPRSAWKTIAISGEERQQLLASMSLRDKVMYAFYAGDLASVASLLEPLKPSAEERTVELAMLAAFAYGPCGVDNSERVRAWCEQIVSRHPNTPWSQFAQKELDDNGQNQKMRRHQDWLLTRFDLNHDGVLDDAEKTAMQKSREFQSEERRYQEDLLLPQLQALIKRYDRDGDSKLSRPELERVKMAVGFFVDAPPSESLERQKAYVAPLLSKAFPAVDTLLKKYDANKDGALDAVELKAFANDLHR